MRFLLFLALVFAGFQASADPIGRGTVTEESYRQVIEGLKKQWAQEDAATVAAGGRIKTDADEPTWAQRAEKYFCDRSCDPRCKVTEVKQIRPWTETTRLPPSMEQKFAGAGDVICTDPSISKIPCRTQMTVLGNRSTLGGVGHFQCGRYEVYKCVFELYDANGLLMFSSKIKSADTSLPKEKYLDQDPREIDWAVAKLEVPVPQTVVPIQIRPVSVEELEKIPNLFIVTIDRRIAGRFYKTATRNLKIQRVGLGKVHFMHDGNTLPDNSGALIYGLQGGVPYAYAINTGHLDPGLNVGQTFTQTQMAHIPGKTELAEVPKGDKNL